MLNHVLYSDWSRKSRHLTIFAVILRIDIIPVSELIFFYLQSVDEMGRKKDTSKFTIGQIQAYTETGLSQRAIATKLGISRCAVQNALKRDPFAKTRSGRVRKTSKRNDRILKNIVSRSPDKASNEIATMAQLAGINISSRTVRRRLEKDFKLPARRPARKPMLTKKQRQMRIKFCKKYKDKPVEWWDKVMFTDESVFQQVRNTGYNYIRRPSGERYNPKYTVKTAKHPPSLMCWGGISSHGTGPLTLIPKGQKVNAAFYVKMLDEKLKTHMDIHGTTILLQDSAPCHTAKTTVNWLAHNGVYLLKDWPSNSPDLNVIENCWALMKIKVSEQRPTSEQALVETLKNVWTQKITSQYCRNLVRSMPARIQAVLKNNGNPTKY